LARGSEKRPAEPWTKPIEVFRALNNERRLQILEWLKEPSRHFRPQINADLNDDGVCGLSIAEKLGLSPATVSEHMRLLVQSGLVRGTRIKQWIFYRRDEVRIMEFTRELRTEL
jgi:DNA-binding transcriptional ArsR family regulator